MPFGRIHRQGIPNDPWVVFLMESTKWLIGSMSLEYILNPSCCSPSPLLPLSHTAHLSILDGARKKWTSLAAVCMGEEIGYSLSSSLSPGGEVIDWEGVSWHWAMPPWRRCDARKVKLCPLRSSKYLNIGCYWPNSVLVLLLWTPRLPRRYSHPWVSIEIGVLWA